RAGSRRRSSSPMPRSSPRSNQAASPRSASFPSERRRSRCASGSAASTTALHAARHQLSLTHERLEDLTRLASDWIWEADANLVVTFVSPRLSEVLGYQPVEFIG